VTVRLVGRKAVVAHVEPVGLRRLLLWIDEGAPVHIEGEGPAARWFADSTDLDRWITKRLRRRPRHLASRRRASRHLASPR